MQNITINYITGKNNKAKEKWSKIKSDINNNYRQL